MKKKSLPATVRLLRALMIFQGISGIFGGAVLIINPAGEWLGLPLAWLNGSPFSDYLIPGLILFFILGLFPLAVSYFLRSPWRLPWFAALLTGIALIIWLAVEIIIIGYQTEPPLQLIYGVVGILILILAILPATVKYYNPR